MNSQGIVLLGIGGAYKVFVEGKTVTASLRGRVKQHSTEKVLVGDRVSLALHPDGSATIEGILPRKSLLQRRSPGKVGGVRAVAANIDQVAVVGAVRRPAWDPHLMDRFIVVAEANGLQPVLVLNKIDLDPNTENLLAPYRQAEYSVIATSVLEKQGIDELRLLLRGRVSLFTGPSGVGKSTLLNALQPGLSLRTGEVTSRAGTGRHTTVAAEMHVFQGDGFVVDTPGLRDIGLWGIAPSEVAGAFPEFSRFSQDCRFDNCRHLSEPGCGLVKAVEGGQLAGSRLESYRLMLGEAVRAAQAW